MSGPHQCRICAAPLGDEPTEGICARCQLAQGIVAEGTLRRPKDPDATIAYESADEMLEAGAVRIPELEMIDQLGKGGMGVIYKARQLRLNRLVAVKFLPQAAGESSVFRERFVREAQTLARLSHPHIVTIFDFGEVGGIPYLVMEYVEGTTLRRLLQNERLNPDHSLQIALAMRGARIRSPGRCHP